MQFELRREQEFVRKMVKEFEKDVRKMKTEYQGCQNCKHQPSPLETCEWLKSQKVFTRKCPRWKLSEVQE